MIRHTLAAIACVALALIGHRASAEDAILIIDAGRVELCVSPKSPSEPVDPHGLIDGSRIWGSDGSDRGHGFRLVAAPGQDEVSVQGNQPNLTLAYSRESSFAGLDLSIHDEIEYIEETLRQRAELMAKLLPTVTQRAQALGATPQGTRVTGLAYVDLDENGTMEYVIEARSAPDPASAETAHPEQFAGVFVLSHDGALLADRVQVLGREDSGSHFGMRLAAIGRNPFVGHNPGHWDFLFETIYENAARMDVDVTVGTTQSKASENARTWSRTIELMYYDAGKFTSRNQIAWVQSKTCFGTGCKK